MRTDVKLGVVLSLAIVLVAGGYYIYRDKTSEPIPVGGKTLADASKPATSQPAQHAAGQKGRPSDAHRANTRNGANRRNGSEAKNGSHTASGTKGNAAAPGRRTVKRSGPAPAAGDNGGSHTASRRGASPAGQPKPPANRTKRGSARAPGEHVARGPSRGPATAGSATPKRTPARTPAADKATEADDSHTPASSPASKTGDADGTRTTVARRGTPATPAANRPGSSAAHRTPRRVPATGGPRSASATPSGSGASQSSAAVDLHKVQPGDTFSALAKSYYGDVKHTDFLIAANPQIENPAALAVGTTLKIPSLPESAAAAPARETPVVKASSRQPAPGARTYTVKPGDTFYGIARSALGDASRWEELFDLNKQVVNGDATRLQVGQVITLPPS